MADYSAREVAFYLAISHATALDLDSAIPSWWDYDAQTEGTAAEGPEILHVLKWLDVQGAKRRVERRRSVEALEMRAQGFTNEEVGHEIGRHPVTVWRQVKAATKDILEELGGTDEAEATTDRLADLLAEITRPQR